jgi:hypothetical protein
MTQVLITGNTFPVKDKLKALGARWDPDRKAWTISSDKADKARQIVESLPPDPKPEYTGKCLKCKGPVKEPFLVCYACKNPGHAQTRDYGNNAPGGRKCSYCGSRECARAWNPHDLCDED